MHIIHSALYICFAFWRFSACNLKKRKKEFVNMLLQNYTIMKLEINLTIEIKFKKSTSHCNIISVYILDFFGGGEAKLFIFLKKKHLLKVIIMKFYATLNLLEKNAN